MIEAMIPKETETLYLGCFMNGLRDEIKHYVCLLALETSLHAFHIARNIEIAINGKYSIVSVPRIKAKRVSVEGGHVLGNTFF